MAKTSGFSRTSRRRLKTGPRSRSCPRSLGADHKGPARPGFIQSTWHGEGFSRENAMIDLKGKVALITGASRGIGAAAAIRFAAAGVDVIVNYNRAELEAARVVNKVRNLGTRAISVQADVSRFEEVERLFRRSVESFGKIDILVANAGVWKGGAIDKLTPQEYRETFEINVTGVFACCQEAAKLMKEQREGNIITVSSTAGQRGEPLHSHYAASKGAVISLTKALASELGPYG